MAIYTFGEHRFDSNSGVVSKDGHEVRLEPVVAKLLAFFLDNPDRVISRQELMEAVWTGKVVSDDTINRGISVLRQSLDQNNKSAFIKTVPKRGYEASFPESAEPAVADREYQPTNPEVELPVSAEGEGITTGPNPNRTRAWQVALLLLVLIGVPVLLVSIVRNEEPAPVPERVTIAVLPFENTSADKRHAYLGEGISDTVISTLSKQAELSVIAKTSSFALMGKNLTISEIGERLGARYVLEGSTQIKNDDLRVNARLIEVETQAQVWSSGFSGNTSDIFAVQDEIAQSTLIALVGATLGLKSAPYRPDFEAYQQVMFGQHAMADQTDAGFRTAADHFSRAIELDADYALAYVLLASAQNLLNSTNPLIHKYEEKEFSEASIQGLLSDALLKEPLLSEAHALKGRLHLQQRELDRAKDALDKALSIDPNNADALADLARLLIDQNENEEAILLVRSAVKLDPQDSSLHQLLATTLWRIGRAEEAMSVIRRNIKNNPKASHNHTLLSRWSLQLGKVFDAMRYAVSEWQLDPDDASKHWAVCLMHFQTWNKRDGLRCINALLSKHPDFYEAKHFQFIATEDKENSLKLIRSQVEKRPDVLYHRLQLAERYSMAREYQNAIDTLSPYFPELISTGPVVNADNIWAARTLALSFMNTGRQQQSSAIAESGLAYLEQSRKLQAGGFTTGVGDVDFLMLLGRAPEAITKLKEALDQDWAFYSYYFFKEPFANVDETEEFASLKASQQRRMDKVQARIASELGSNLGF